jgi:hypothetical protein
MYGLTMDWDQSKTLNRQCFAARNNYLTKHQTTFELDHLFMQAWLEEHWQIICSFKMLFMAHSINVNFPLKKSSQMTINGDYKNSQSILFCFSCLCLFKYRFYSEKKLKILNIAEKKKVYGHKTKKV